MESADHLHFHSATVRSLSILSASTIFQPRAFMLFPFIPLLFPRLAEQDELDKYTARALLRVDRVGWLFRGRSNATVGSMPSLPP